MIEFRNELFLAGFTIEISETFKKIVVAYSVIAAQQWHLQSHHWFVKKDGSSVCLF